MIPDSARLLFYFAKLVFSSVLALRQRDPGIKFHVILMIDPRLIFKLNPQRGRIVFVAGHRQIALAREEKLPMIIHSREAAADTLRVMKEEKSEEIGGVIHCFSYSVEMAEEYLKMGFYLGIGGVVTFKNAK